MRDRLLNGDAGLAALLGAVGLYWMVGAVPLGFWRGFAPAAGFLPFCYGLVLLALSAAVLGQIGTGRADGAAPDQAGFAKPVLIMVVIGVALLGLQSAGFAISIFLTLLVLFVLVERLRFLPSLAVTLAITAGLHLLFRVWLGVPLPKGPLGI